MGFKVQQKDDGSQYKLNDGKWTDFPKDVQKKTSDERLEWIYKGISDKVEEKAAQVVEQEKRVAESRAKRTKVTPPRKKRTKTVQKNDEGKVTIQH